MVIWFEFNIVWGYVCMLGTVRQADLDICIKQQKGCAFWMFVTHPSTFSICLDYLKAPGLNLLFGCK